MARLSALLAILCSGIGAQAQPASCIDAAREAARADRNADSAALFECAIARSPERRGEFLPDYADQLTYSHRAAQAVPLYREALASAPEGEPRTRLLKGLGLALLWSDQPGAAARIYEEVLQRQPGDADARRNLARALSWSGRQRQARRVLEPWLRDHPDDGQARLQLAESQVWMGRSDLALRTLEAVPGADRPEAARLRRELALELRPRSFLDAQHSRQSDSLDIDVLRAGHDLSLVDGRGMAGLRLSRARFERQDGSDGARVERATAVGRWRIDDASEINAELGREHLSPRNGAARDLTVYSTWFTWWPHDVLRVDLSASRSTLDNLRSLEMGLALAQRGVSVDVTPSERQRYNLRYERGRYSDGNGRWTAGVSGEYRWLNAPQVWVGLRHSRMAFEQLLNNGYFNPDEFEATQATVRVSHRFGGDRPWDVSAFAAWGREHAVPDGSKPAYDVSLAVGRQLAPRLRLEGRLQRFSSRTSALSGFGRTTAGLRLEYRW